MKLVPVPPPVTMVGGLPAAPSRPTRSRSRPACASTLRAPLGEGRELLKMAPVGLHPAEGERRRTIDAAGQRLCRLDAGAARSPLADVEIDEDAQPEPSGG